ncbi:MAG: ATP synthase F1 subunit delta [Balneolaceae bacterium]
MVSKAARRYAHAFLETAIEQGSLEKVREDMLFIQNTIGDSSELKIFLRSPVVKKSVKKSALEAIFSGKVQQLTMDLISILSEKGREDLLYEICDGFFDQYNVHHGIIEVDVQTAFDLKSNEKDSLQKILEKNTGKKVQMDITVDESLIGGLTVRIDDTVIDGSVKYKLSQLKDKFIAATVEQKLG